MSVDTLVAYWPICRPICGLIFGIHVDRCISRHIDQALVDISADTRSTCQLMCGRYLILSGKYQLTYRPSLNQYVGRYIDQHSPNQCRPSLSAKYQLTIGQYIYVGLYFAKMSTDTRPIVVVDSWPRCQAICQPTGALSAHDPLFLNLY